MQSSEVSNGDAREIFELLLAGDTLEFDFPSLERFQAFRVRLYQVKKAVVEKYTDLGMLNEDEVESLIFEKRDIDPGFHTYRVYLGKRKRETQKYPFRIITP